MMEAWAAGREEEARKGSDCPFNKTASPLVISLEGKHLKHVRQPLQHMNNDHLHKWEEGMEQSAGI